MGFLLIISSIYRVIARAFHVWTLGCFYSSTSNKSHQSVSQMLLYKIHYKAQQKQHLSPMAPDIVLFAIGVANKSHDMSGATFFRVIEPKNARNSTSYVQN